MKRISVVLALALAPAAPALAQTPLGGEFQINTSTTNNQLFPDVAHLPDGRFLVVWSSAVSSGTDTSGASIQGRFYAANGSPSSNEFQVNTYTTGTQVLPSLAVRPNGDFVIVWVSAGSSGTDTGTTFSIQGQRFTTTGAKVGSQFQINTYTTANQGSPSLRMDADGNFVVVWENFGSPVSDTSPPSIQGQRYSANGVPLGGEFQINTYTTGGQSAPSVDAAPDGSFVVAWQSEGSFGSDAFRSIQARRYAPNGVPLSTEFQVNSSTEGTQSSAQIASKSTGDFVIGWIDFSPSTGTHIKAQRYAADGSAEGEEFRLDSTTSSSSFLSDISATPDGRFVVVWYAYATSGGDTSGRSVQGRVFSAEGGPQGPAFQVNTYTTDSQRAHAVAADDDDFIVVWDTPESAGPDTSGWSVWGRRYTYTQFEVPALTSAQAALCALGLLITGVALRTRRRA